MHILYIQVQCISLHSTSVIASWFSILSSLGSGCPEAAIILYNSLLYSYSLQSTSGISIKPFQKIQETKDNALSKKKKKMLCFINSRTNKVINIYFYDMYPSHSISFSFWSILDLQCCVNFKCMAKWFNYIYIHIFGLPWWLRWWRIFLQCVRPTFDPRVGKIPWKREWQPTPVFLPGEFHGRRRLACYSPWDCNESDATEWLTLSLNTYI